MAAFFCVFLLIMVAFAVDFTWTVLAQAELQNTSDAAALAGANMLADNFVAYYLPNQTQAQKDRLLADAQTAARKAARDYASYNGAGELVSLTLRDEDIEFGFLDAANAYTPLPTYTEYPNTVKVKMRRDSVSNGDLKLFFARVIGTSQIALGASASATLYTGQIDSYQPNNKTAAGILPITYDVNHWNEFLKSGKDPDNKTSLAADGNPQLQVYPSIKYKGNFGLLSLSDDHTGDSTIRAWVKDGVSDSDIGTLIDHKLIPLSARTEDAWDWRGNTGLQATFVMEANDYTNKTFLLPLFKPKNPDPSAYRAAVGNGQQFDFNIVAFVGVKIMPVSRVNKDIVIQPAAYIEPAAVFKTGTITPAQPPSDGSLLVTTFTTPRLTR